MKNKSKTTYNIYDEERNIRHGFLRWGIAGIIVFSVYIAGAIGLYHYSYEPELLAAPPEAIMLEFADEPTTLQVDAFSEQIRPALQKDDIKPREEEKVNPEPEKQEEKIEDVQPEAMPKPIETPKSDFVEDIKKPQKPQDKVKKRETRPLKKVEKKKELKKTNEKPSHKINQIAEKSEKNQSASGPQLNAKQASTYAAPYNSRRDGSNGKSEKAWDNQVQRKIQRIARSMERQSGGVRGVADVTFSFDASGRIISKRVNRSSGNAKVDQFAIKIIERSSPLPSPPSGAGTRTVPIRLN